MLLWDLKPASGHASATPQSTSSTLASLPFLQALPSLHSSPFLLWGKFSLHSLVWSSPSSCLSFPSAGVAGTSYLSEFFLRLSRLSSQQIRSNVFCCCWPFLRCYSIQTANLGLGCPVWLSVWAVAELSYLRGSWNVSLGWSTHLGDVFFSPQLNSYLCSERPEWANLRRQTYKALLQNVWNLEHFFSNYQVEMRWPYYGHEIIEECQPPEAGQNI